MNIRMELGSEQKRTLYDKSFLINALAHQIIYQKSNS